MRIVIDLQACQQAGGGASGATVALARELARTAGPHELWLALSNQFPHQLAPLRAAFAELLPARRIVVYDTPAPDGSAATDAAIALIRANFFDNLAPGLVFAPGWCERATTVGVLAPGAAVGVTDARAAQAHRNALGQAALLVAASPAVAAALRQDLPGAQPPIVCAAPDPAACAQALWPAFEQAAATPVASTAAPAGRPPLAYVAPLQHLDRALLAELARHYDVELVSDASAPAPDLVPGIAVRDAAWFEQHGGRFARVVYQLGNTAAHRFMPALCARHAGVLLLGEFHLGQAVDSDDGHGFGAALLRSHGYGALLARQRAGQAEALRSFPASWPLIEQAAGVIVPSDAMRELGRHWYGQAGDSWRALAPLQGLDAAGAARLGLEYAAAIEQFSAHSAAARLRALTSAIGALGMPSDPRSALLLGIAKAIGANQPSDAPRQLLVDISAVVETDFKTGIQRVVRSILLALIKSPPPGLRVEPVYSTGGERRYRHARRFTCAMLGESALAQSDALDDTPIEHRPGDIFLGLDLVAHCTTGNRALLTDMRAHGMAVYFVVYDLLPLLMPKAFPYGTDTYFREYLGAIAELADGLVCISRSVADELCDWLAAHPVPRPAPLKVGFFHMGADLDASAPSSGLPGNAAQVLAAVAARPTLLMVGTLEPRKGHAQALAAFELLWKRGLAVNLVIVGKAGWLVEGLVKRLEHHPERDARLFWLPGVSDEMLGKLYASASGLLAASVGEGFGLPLIESAQHRLPIVARNLTVFREIGGEHAFYFDGDAPAELARALEEWLELLLNDNVPPSSGMPWLSWADSAEQLLESVVGQRWYRVLPGSAAQ